MEKREGYAWWKHVCFWGMWILLLAPGYCAAFGAWLIGSMLPDFHQPVDIVLTLIMIVTLFILMCLAVYTGWHFVKCTRHYSHLLLSLLAGLLGVPMLSALSAIGSYVLLSA